MAAWIGAVKLPRDRGVLRRAAAAVAARRLDAPEGATLVLLGLGGCVGSGPSSTADPMLAALVAAFGVPSSCIRAWRRAHPLEQSAVLAGLAADSDACGPAALARAQGLGTAGLARLAALLVQHCTLVHAGHILGDPVAADEAACAIAAMLGAAEAVGAQEGAEGEGAEEQQQEEEEEEEAGLPAVLDEQLAADVFGSLQRWLAEAGVADAVAELAEWGRALPAPAAMRSCLAPKGGHVRSAMDTLARQMRDDVVVAHEAQLEATASVLELKRALEDERKPLRASVANVLRQLRLLAEPVDSTVTMHEGLTRTGQLLELAASPARGVGAVVRAEALRLAQRRFGALAAALAAAAPTAPWAVATAGRVGALLERLRVGGRGEPLRKQARSVLFRLLSALATAELATLPPATRAACRSSTRRPPPPSPDSASTRHPLATLKARRRRRCTRSAASGTSSSRSSSRRSQPGVAARTFSASCPAALARRCSSSCPRCWRRAAAWPSRR